MSLKHSQIIVWECDAPGCTNTRPNAVQIPYGSEPMKPHLPPGWRIVGRRCFCNDHNLEIIVDGKHAGMVEGQL